MLKFSASSEGWPRRAADEVIDEERDSADTRRRGNIRPIERQGIFLRGQTNIKWGRAHLARESAHRPMARRA
jgi:hypothetical protein